MVFSIFDTEGCGSIAKDDVIAVAASMRKDFALVIKMLDKVQDNTISDTVSFGEFVTLLWQLE